MNVTKAISVRQPWASCIATTSPLAKRVENRGRNCTHRGPVAIHASRTPDLRADTDPRVVRLCGKDPRLGKPVGAILAVADLVDCHEAVPVSDGTACCAPWGELDYLRGGQAVRAYHLVLDNVRVLDWPVYCNGQLSVPWNLKQTAWRQVTDQIEALT